MKALITGASSGIGESLAIQLSQKGYEVIAIGRNIERLNKLKEKINCTIESNDISIIENCYKLFEKYQDIDLLINNAGFGDNGFFTQTDLNKELNMINTNINSLHVLTKLYLKKMVEDNKGNILNIGSIAGFLPGPLMATYYATKAYVVSLTKSVSKELKKSKSKVYIGALCPGPVKTRFFDRANASFMKTRVTSDYVAKYAIKKMNKKKVIIIPTLSIKLARLSAKLLPDNLVSSAVYSIQSKRKN